MPTIKPFLVAVIALGIALTTAVETATPRFFADDPLQPGPELVAGGAGGALVGGGETRHHDGGAHENASDRPHRGIS